MMGEWRERSLGELLDVKHGFAFLGQHFGEAGTHIVLTPGNFFERGGFKPKGDKEKWYSGAVPDEYVLRRGDIIVAMTEQAEGLLGASAIVPEDDLYLHNQRLGLVQIRNGEADPGFIYHLFNTKSVRQQIRASASGAKVRHTAPSRIAAVRVSVPGIKEQQRIGEILSAYDDLIENCEKRIRVLDEMGRLLYREWFVRFRYPGHEKTRSIASRNGGIPKGWRHDTLSTVARVNAEQVNTKRAPSRILYIDISSVSPGRIDAVTGYEFDDAPGRARRVVHHGDVLWSCVRPNRRSHALVLSPQEDTIASTGFAVLTAKSVPFTYLYAATTTDEFVEYLEKRATGAAYPAVTAKVFEDAPLLIPDAAVLERFGAAATPLAEAIALLRRRIENLRNTRELLLPRLLSGSLVLRDAA